MHLDQERLERLLHGELPPGVLDAARAHMATCDECRARAGEAASSEVRIHALLEQLDQPVPRYDLQAVIEQARTRDRAWMRWAAGIVLVAALGGVAYAAPGSPVRAFVESLWPGPRVEAPIAPAALPLEGGPPEPAAAGIAVPARRRLVIEFTSPGEGARVQVVLGDGEDVVVRAPAGAATFSSLAERVEVSVRDRATVDVEIPRRAPRVELTVGGRRIFLKAGDTITTSHAVGTGTSWLLPLGDDDP